MHYNRLLTSLLREGDCWHRWNPSGPVGSFEGGHLGCLGRPKNHPMLTFSRIPSIPYFTIYPCYYCIPNSISALLSPALLVLFHASTSSPSPLPSLAATPVSPFFYQ